MTSKKSPVEIVVQLDSDISAIKQIYSLCNHIAELRSLSAFHIDKDIFTYISHQLTEALALYNEG